MGLSHLVKGLEEVIWTLEMRTQHLSVGDAKYYSNDVRTQLLPTQCLKKHACFPEEAAGQGLIEGRRLCCVSQPLSSLYAHWLLFHKAGADSKALNQQGPVWLATPGSSPHRNTGSCYFRPRVCNTDAAAALHPGLCEIMQWSSEVNK